MVFKKIFIILITISAVTCSKKEDIGEYYPPDYDPYFKMSLSSDFKGNILKTKKDAINLAKVYISSVYGDELLNDDDNEYDVNLVDNIWYIYINPVAKKIDRKALINDDNDSPYSELILDDEIPVSGGGFYVKISNDDGRLLGIRLGK